MLNVSSAIEVKKKYYKSIKHNLILLLKLIFLQI